MYEFSIVDNANNAEEFDDCVIFTTKQWLKFLEYNKYFSLTPLFLEIRNNGEKLGFFVGCIFYKFGIKICGSPFRGWNTPNMGCVLRSNISVEERITIIQEVWKNMKKNHNVHYMEIIDPKILFEKTKGISNDDMHVCECKNLESDISISEEDILKGYTKHCKKNIKQFKNRGGYVLPAKNIEKFIDIYYSQLQETFASQKMKPSYDKGTVKECINAVMNISPQNLLLLQAFNSEGICVGTTISFAFGDVAYTFGSGNDKRYRLNQGFYLRYCVMCHWHKLGYKRYDFMGMRQYKLDFNPKIINYAKFTFSKYKFFFKLRTLCEKIYWKLNELEFKAK